MEFKTILLYLHARKEIDGSLPPRFKARLLEVKKSKGFMVELTDTITGKQITNEMQLIVHCERYKLQIAKFDIKFHYLLVDYEYVLEEDYTLEDKAKIVFAYSKSLAMADGHSFVVKCCAHTFYMKSGYMKHRMEDHAFSVKK